jgi:hypothetical protein
LRAFADEHESTRFWNFDIVDGCHYAIFWVKCPGERGVVYLLGVWIKLLQ